MTGAAQQFVIDETEPAGGAREEKQTRGPSADQARVPLKELLGEIIDQALFRHEIWSRFESDDHSDAPHSAIKVTTGTGKSDLIRQELARFVIEARRQKLPHRVLVLLPTHRLADEARNRIPLGITSAIWQGSGGTLLGTDEPMCRNPEAVEAALKLGAIVEKAACEHKGTYCPFYHGCAYQAQKGFASAVDVVFCAHEILFRVPKALGKNFGLVVVDEGFWQDGISANRRLVISGLADELKEFPVRGRNGTKLDIETMYLRDLIERLQNALAAMPDGYVIREQLIEAGLKPATSDEDSSCSAARKLEWKRKVDAGLRPGANDDARKKAVKKFGFIGQLPRRHAMWRILDDLIAGNDDAAGGLRIETSTTQEGSQRYLRLLDRKKIAERLITLPLIHADATLPVELVQHFLPNLRLDTDLDVDAPHMKIVQVIGLPVGKSSLQSLPPGKRRADQEERVARKRKRLVDACRHLAQGRRGLIVTYKDIEKDFEGIEGVEVAHFGAIEGIDRWRDVDVVVIIGRPLPRPDDIERMAAAITGQPVIAGATVGQHVTILAGRLAGQIIKRRIYATPEAEMVRRAVTEAAIVQAVGRARGVNRTKDCPVEIYLILDDTVVPGLKVDEVVELGDIEPSAIDHMIARGLTLQMPTDAAKLHPDLFPSRNTAKQAYHRAGFRMKLAPGGGRLVTLLYRDISIKGCNQPPCVALRFQPGGRGHLPRFCIADPAKVSDPRAVLEAALGPLALFEVLTRPEPAAAASEAAE